VGRFSLTATTKKSWARYRKTRLNNDDGCVCVSERGEVGQALIVSEIRQRGMGLLRQGEKDGVRVSSKSLRINQNVSHETVKRKRRAVITF
jgi:cytoskeletal protein CcmA (bactofilin family)